MAQRRILGQAVILLLLLATIMWRVQAAGTASVKLSGLMPAFGDVEDFKISPDGQYAVYRADQTTDLAVELYSVAISSGSPVRLNPLLPAGLQVGSDYLISPDSQYVVYRAELETTGISELFSVPINGPASASVKLNPALVANGAVSPVFAISPDGSRVVYRADSTVDDVVELFSVPINGPATANVKLNPALVSGGNVSTDFRLSPDGSRVVYRADMFQDELVELFSVPLLGPASASVKLNGVLASGGDVSADFAISSDSQWVVYRADQLTNDMTELYSVPIAGPSAAGIRLNKTLPAGGSVASDFVISPDSSRVVYRAPQNTAGVDELYSVPIGGPATAGIRLNKTLASGGNVSSGFAISPDSLYVVYRADQNQNEVVELFSVPIAGPASAGNRLNPNLTAGGDVSTGFLLSADGQWVVYRADVHTDARTELLSVPVNGPNSATVILNAPLYAGQSVSSDVIISPQSDRVVFRSDQEVNDINQLHSVPIAGPAAASLILNGPLVSGGDVVSGVGITPNGSHAVYRADQSSDDIIELYRADILTKIGFGESEVILGENMGTVALPLFLWNPRQTVTHTVQYAVTAGTATGGGVDYELDDGELVFPPGQFSQWIPITITQDFVAESFETVSISLSSPQGGVLGSHPSLTVLIADQAFRTSLPRIFH